MKGRIDEMRERRGGRREGEEEREDSFILESQGRIFFNK